MARRATVPLAAITVAIVFLGACASGGSTTQIATEQPHQHGASTGFEQLLGHHATLVTRMMRAQLGEDPDLRDAVDAALEDNTDQLEAAIAATYGANAGREFESLWLRHIELLASYTIAASKDDERARTRAAAGLDDYRNEYGAFIEALTRAAIPAPVAAENLRVHLSHLREFADAYARRDFVRAFALERQAFQHMFPTAQALTRAAAGPTPGELPVAPDPAQQLRSTLGMLLGEHFELAVDATRSAVRGSDDFEAAAEALNGNTRDLTGAFDALFGAERAAQFNAAWSDHIDGLVQYAVAVAEDDGGRRQEVAAALDPVRTRQAATLSELTGGRLSLADALFVLVRHDEQLVRQLDAYAAEDYATAHRLAFEGYGHMFETAAVLAPAIEAAIDAQLPTGGVQTGGAGRASSPRDGGG